jgi:hypothetical protein
MSGTWGTFVLFFLAMMFILLERRNEAPGMCSQGRKAAWLSACAGSADIAILLLGNQLTG